MQYKIAAVRGKAWPLGTPSYLNQLSSQISFLQWAEEWAISVLSQEGLLLSEFLLEVGQAILSGVMDLIR